LAEVRKRWKWDPHSLAIRRGERYYVHELAGYSVGPGARGSSASGTTVCVFDTIYPGREMARFLTRGRSLERARMLARQTCNELNAREREEASA